MGNEAVPGDGHEAAATPAPFGPRRFYSMPLVAPQADGDAEATSIEAAPVVGNAASAQEEAAGSSLLTGAALPPGEGGGQRASRGESAPPQAKQGDLLSYIRGQVIGSDATFLSPFGRRLVVYTDYTASARSVACIEAFIRAQVLPFYGNTHTTTTVTGLQTTRMRHEARDILRNATNASEHDAVIFCGSGVTGGLHKLVHNLGVQQVTAPRHRRNWPAV